MRILRGKSNLEVSYQGFAWFLIGLVLVTFMGGAIRTILNSERVHERIVTELTRRLPKQRVKIEKTEVRLANGIWPGLVLKMQNVDLSQETCGRLSFHLVVPQLELPISLMSLLRGAPKVSYATLVGGGLELDHIPCEQNEATRIGQSQSLPQADEEPSKIRVESKTLDWRRLRDYLGGVRLDEFSLRYRRQDTWKAQVSQMDVDFGSNLEFRGQVQLQKSLPFGSISHDLDISGKGDEESVSWNIRSEFKEGRLDLKGTSEMSGGASVVQLMVRQFPLKEVMAELFQMGLVERDLNVKAAWLSCNAKWEGLLGAMHATPVSLRQCHIEGTYGRVALQRADLWLSHGEWLKVPMILEIQQLSLKPVLELVGREVLPAVISKLGVWSGVVEFLNRRTWKMKGQLEQMEINVSSRSIRGKQIVDSLDTEISVSSDQVAGKIYGIRPQGGEFAGNLSFSLRTDFRTGPFYVNIDKLRVHPTVQGLLAGQAIGNLSVHGQGFLQEGELSQWSGRLSLESIEGDGWSGEKIAGATSYSPGTFVFNVTASSLKVNSQWLYFQQLTQIKKDPPSEWRDVKARFDFTHEGGVVKLFEGREAQSKRVWQVKGNWVRDGKFNGQLSINGERKVYGLMGERDLLSILEEGPLK